MPERSYIHEEDKTLPGFKAFKGRVTLLGENVVGFKLKPFLIYLSNNQHALKQVSKHMLPVYYHANNKVWMMQDLFEDWFSNCFIPSVKHYCLEKGIPFKIILLLDNAPGHPTTILQPLDQGAIAMFKAYYLHTTFSKAVAATENDEIIFHVFWKSYNILQCIRNIASASEGVTKQCMQGIWKKCLKVFVNIFEGFEQVKLLDVTNKKKLQNLLMCLI